MKLYKDTPDSYIVGSVAFIFGGILFGILVTLYDIKNHTFDMQLALLNAAFFIVAYLFSMMKKK
jgi:hypothetical protein